MFLQLQATVSPSTSPSRKGSFCGSASIEDLERSYEDIGHWDGAAQLILQQVGSEPFEPGEPSLGPCFGQWVYLKAKPVTTGAAKPPHPEPPGPRKSLSARVVDVLRSHRNPVLQTESRRSGSACHSSIADGSACASADALIAAYGAHTDVDATIARLNAFLDAYAARWPNCHMAQPQMNGELSLVNRARIYTRSKALCSLNHKDSAHYFLAGSRGQPPGFAMRRMLAIVWRCAETWVDPTQTVPSIRGRRLLQEAVVHAVANFSLEPSRSETFCCIPAQLTLLMRALHGHRTSRFDSTL